MLTFIYQIYLVMPAPPQFPDECQGLARYSDLVQPGQEDMFLVGPSITLPERVLPAKVS